MLYKYLDLLHRATDSLTSLGGSNATWTDCFKTIGYEFLVLGIGILYVAAIAAIILIPTVGLVKMLKKDQVSRTSKAYYSYKIRL